MTDESRTALPLRSVVTGVVMCPSCGNHTLGADGKCRRGNCGYGQLPLRDALMAAWDDAWNFLHDYRLALSEIRDMRHGEGIEAARYVASEALRHPTIEGTGDLEMRFLDLLDELERRTT